MTDNKSKVCENCGGDIPPGSKITRKYCCTTCRVKAFQARRMIQDEYVRGKFKEFETRLDKLESLHEK